MTNAKKAFFKGDWVDELTCKEFVEWVTDYLANKLPAVDHLRFDAHLAQCSACPHYLEQMQLTIQTVGRLSENLTEVDPSAKHELLDLFRKWKDENQHKSA